jgi:hypothetical protein
MVLYGDMPDKTRRETPGLSRHPRRDIAEMHRAETACSAHVVTLDRVIAWRTATSAAMTREMTRRDDVSLIWIRSLAPRRVALDTSAGPIDVAERIVRHIER